MLQDLLSKCKKNFEDNKFDESRTFADRAIKDIFGDKIDESNQFAALEEGLFLSELGKADVSNKNKIAQFLSQTFELIDYYAILNEYYCQKKNGVSPDKVLRNICLLFPGHLMAQRAISMIQNKGSTITFYGAKGHYGNKEFPTYNDSNLQGIVNRPPSTFVDHVISNLDIAPEDGLVPYVIAAGYIFNIECVESRTLDNIVKQNSSSLATNLSTFYEKIMKNARTQWRGVLKRMVVDFAISYKKLSSSIDLESVKGIKIQNDKNQGKVREFAEKLPRLLNSLGPELLELLLDCEGTDYLIGYDAFEQRINEARGEIEKFIQEWSIDEKYRDRAQLVDALKEHKVNLCYDVKGFFERLRWTIQYGNKFKGNYVVKSLEEHGISVYSNDISEAVDCARWDLADEHGLLSFRGKGGFIRVYVGINKSSTDDPKESDFWAIKIPHETERAKRICEKAGVELTKRRREDLADVQTIKHKNVCTCHRHTTKEGLIYFDEELFYQTVEDRVTTEGPYSVSNAKEALLQIASGLEACHEKGIIHQDIKPDNIGIKNEHMLSDFGVATLYAKRLSREENIGSLMGMAPELYEEGKHPNARSDLFSLGVVLFYMIFGEYHYFTKECSKQSGMGVNIPGLDKSEIAFTPGRGRTQAVGKLVNCKANSAFYQQTLDFFKAKTKDDVLTEVLGKLLHPNPNERYKSTDELLKALQS